jgi:hypothetical protein
MTVKFWGRACVDFPPGDGPFDVAYPNWEVNSTEEAAAVMKRDGLFG